MDMTTTIIIRGMRSRHCVNAVFTSLAGVSGATRADVTVGRAVVEHDGRATADSLRAAVALAGYEVEELIEERRRLPLL